MKSPTRERFVIISENRTICEMSKLQIVNRISGCRKIFRLRTITESVERYPTMQQHLRHTHRRHNISDVIYPSWRRPQAYYFYQGPYHRFGALKAAVFLGSGIIIGSYFGRKQGSHSHDWKGKDAWDRCGKGKVTFSWEPEEHKEGCQCEYCYFRFLKAKEKEKQARNEEGEKVTPNPEIVT